MRVLHVIESMGRGGAERNFATLLPHLKTLGVESVVATLWGGHAHDDQLTRFAVRRDFGLQPGPAFTALPGLCELARAADVVHTQLPWADIVGRMAALATGKPSVTTLHSTQYDRDNTARLRRSIQMKVAIIQMLDSASARTTRQFFAVSPAVRDSYVRELQLPAERIEVAPCVIDPEEFDPARQPPRDELRARYGMTPDEIAVVAVGRLVPGKRQGDAIEAVAGLDRRAVRLFVAGAGSEDARLRTLARQMRSPTVFLGERTDVANLLHAADVFLFPTLFEGMPLALLEAMAMGKACLCTDIEEIRQLGGDGVRYFPVRDVARLRENLLGLIDDPGLRKSLGERARARALQFADPRAAARRFVDKIAPLTEHTDVRDLR